MSDNNKQNKQNMTILDQMISDDNLQMMKAALPYIDIQGQRFLSIYAKVLELQKTMTLFQNSSAELTMMSTPETKPSPLEMLNDLKEYANPSMKEGIEGMVNMLTMMELVQIYQSNEEE